MGKVVHNNLTEEEMKGKVSNCYSHTDVFYLYDSKCVVKDRFVYAETFLRKRIFIYMVFKIPGLFSVLDRKQLF